MHFLIKVFLDSVGLLVIRFDGSCEPKQISSNPTVGLIIMAGEKYISESYKNQNTAMYVEENNPRS